MTTLRAAAASDPARRARQTVHDRRDAAERVLQLAGHLADADRLLLEQVFRHGVSLAEVARLSGQRPRVLQRRVRRLLLRLNDPLFRFVAGRCDLLPQEVQATARRTVLHGRSLRDTARATGRSLHQIRQHLIIIRALASQG